MKHSILLSDKALCEAREAYLYYEEKQKMLGERFSAELEKSIESIASNPKKSKIIKDEIRQCIVDVFPFVIVYEIFEFEVVVYSIFHTNRNPKYKINKKKYRSHFCWR